MQVPADIINTQTYYSIFILDFLVKNIINYNLIGLYANAISTISVSVKDFTSTKNIILLVKLSKH